jgi:hypothetical protein
MTQQIFGIANHRANKLISAHGACTVLKYANGIHSIARTFATIEGNIYFTDQGHTWHANKCAYCGAGLNEYKRESELETHAYSFIHSKTIHKDLQKMFGEKMQFDVIVGNPPYQLSDGGHGASAIPIYHKFVEQAKKLEPKFLSFVIPARWLAGGKGLTDFRESMLNDKRLVKITDYINSKECFPGVSIGGGVCYFLWNRDYEGECEYINILNNDAFSMNRRLNEHPIFIRFNKALSIINKLNINSENSLSCIVDSRNPFGITSSTRGKNKKFDGALTLYASDGFTYINTDLVTNSKDKIQHYKLMISKVISEHAGEPDKNGKMKIISKVEVLKPNEVCTDSYLCMGKFKTLSEANNALDYMKTKFARFLMLQAISSINLSKEKFFFIPMQNFSETWSDKKLYEKYKLNDTEISFIENIIKPMKPTYD